MKRKLCVFDLDGTLVNTMGDIVTALNVALTDSGLAVLNEAQVSAIVGYSTRYMFEHAVPAGREDCVDAVAAAYEAYYPRHCCDKSAPYAGVLELLTALKEAGMLLAVVSNKPHRDTITVVNTLFPRDTFQMVLGRMTRFAIKPDPEPLNFVLNYLGIAKEDAIYIGDSEVDVQFAKNTGMACVSVSWGFRSKQELVDAGATQIVDDVEQLRRALMTEGA